LSDSLRVLCIITLVVLIAAWVWISRFSSIMWTLTYWQLNWEPRDVLPMILICCKISTACTTQMVSPKLTRYIYRDLGCSFISVGLVWIHKGIQSAILSTRPFYSLSFLEEEMVGIVDEESSYHGSKSNGLYLDRSRRDALAEVDNAKFSFVALRIWFLITIIEFLWFISWFHARVCIVAGVGFFADA